MKACVVSIKELGTNCWSPKRFCGGRCSKVFSCKYPEKKTCMAVKSEIDFIEQNSKQRITEIQQNSTAKLVKLKNNR